jgi:hypothetical protein
MTSGAPSVARTEAPEHNHSFLNAGVIDACLAVAVALSVLLVHDVRYMLTHAFWVDEAWVADTLRARIGLTSSLASSTPLGWAYLLRLVPFGGLQRARLVPLAFTMLAAATGYLFGRELRLTPYVTGILTGAAVLLSPAMLVRDDLKQYTAEAFLTTALWLLVARIENEWTRRRLIVIAAVGSAGLFFANTVIFIGVAAMAALAFECLVKKQYRRLFEVGCASAGMLVVSGAIYLIFVRPQVTTILTNDWNPNYMPTHSVSAAVTFLRRELVENLVPYLGFGSLAVDTALILAGIGALLWLRRYALAVMFPVTLVLVIAASAARKYPFGDLRTSTFWLVNAPLLMAVAAATAAHLAGRADRRLPLVVAVVALVIWVPATNPYIRSRLIPNENVRAEVDYLDAHYRPGDVVIVDYAASYGFSYYWPRANPSYPRDIVGPNVHVAAYPGVNWMIVMRDRQPVDVANALAQARAKIAAEPAGSRGRIWIVRSHLGPPERRVWHRRLAGDRVTVIRVGPEPILLYSPS